MTPNARRNAAHLCQTDDRWRRIRTGTVSRVLGRNGHMVELQHPNGRVTRKWIDQFAAEFEPVQEQDQPTGDE